MDLTSKLSKPLTVLVSYQGAFSSAFLCEEGDISFNQQKGWDSGSTHCNGKGGGEIKLYHQLLLLLLTLLRKESYISLGL